MWKSVTVRPVCRNWLLANRPRRARNRGRNAILSFRPRPVPKKSGPAKKKPRHKIDMKILWPQSCREKRIDYRNVNARFFLRSEPSRPISLMTPTSLIVVVDRGTLKAYRVDETPTRGPSLHLIQAFNITDAHGKDR